MYLEDFLNSQTNNFNRFNNKILVITKNSAFMRDRKLKITPWLESFEDILEELADELVYNYLANSFGDDGIADLNFETITNPEKSATKHGLNWLGMDSVRNVTIGEYFNQRRKQRRRCRNVMIIGAGASFDAYGAIPLGRQMIASFRDIFANKIESIPFLKEKFEHEQNEIRKLLIGDLDFENFLYLLSTFFVKQESLREEIKSHTGFRYAPNLFYETAAHLLKHQFLDTIINFNFDEILDQAILEELGKDNYHFVLSDGHTLNMDDLIVDGRIKAPIYIKPHGTFSHKSSLRFTKRHYLDLPLDIQEMLAGLLSGYRGAGKEVQRVNLICVGFDLASLEFNDIINKHLAPSSRIYHFLHEEGKDTVSIKEEKRVKIFQKHFESFLERASANGHEFDEIYKPVNLAQRLSSIAYAGGEVNTVTSPLGEVFSNLWRLAYSRFNEFNRPRSLGRHEIISYFFYNTQFAESPHTLESASETRKNIRNYYDESPKYFRDRVLVEIAIELLRNNGNADIVELLRSRTGHYFDKYLWACSEFKTKIRLRNSIYDFMYEFTPEGEKPKSLDKEKRFEATKMIFRILPPDDDELDSIFEQLKSNFAKPLDKLYNSSLSISKSNYIDNFINELKAGYYQYKSKSELGATLLLYLLKSDMLSSDFRQNLLRNYQKTIYNGLAFNTTEDGYKRNSLCRELFRIFTKTNANASFFNIHSRINDPTYKFLESLSPEKILHTNLILDTDFKMVFNGRNWDCLLTVLDSGDSIKKIFRQHFKKYTEYYGVDEQMVSGARSFFESLKSKTILLLCSMETVDQIHLLRNKAIYNTKSYKGIEFWSHGAEIASRTNPATEVYKIEALNELHTEYFFDFITTEIKESTNEEKKNEMQRFADLIKGCLKIVFVPFWEHNHHCSVFLKSVAQWDEILENAYTNMMVIDNADDKNAEELNFKNSKKYYTQKKYIYLFEGAYHMYRRGFSNTVTPVKLVNTKAGVKTEYLMRDVDKMLQLFFNMLCKGITYQVQNAQLIEYHDAFMIKDLMSYRSWSPGSFYKNMRLFLGNLYGYAREKYKN